MRGRGESKPETNCRLQEDGNGDLLLGTCRRCLVLNRGGAKQEISIAAQLHALELTAKGRPPNVELR